MWSLNGAGLFSCKFQVLLKKKLKIVFFFFLYFFFCVCVLLQHLLFVKLIFDSKFWAVLDSRKGVSMCPFWIRKHDFIHRNHKCLVYFPDCIFVSLFHFSSYCKWKHRPGLIQAYLSFVLTFGPGSALLFIGLDRHCSILHQPSTA